MDLLPKKQPDFGQHEDVIYLEGFFFVTKSVIEKNDEVVQKTFNNFYKYVNYN